MHTENVVNRPFIKGLKLSELFYDEAVKPILSARFPNVPYSAALLGRGSDVLGFDTPQSMDHDWGPRLMLFLEEADYAAYRDQIDQSLRQELPPEIHGYPTNFALHEDGTAFMKPAADPPIDHKVAILAVAPFFQSVLGFDPIGGIGAIDWLTVPEQILRGVTAGRVFHDGLGQLEPIRARLRYYPHDVWLYLLAAQWKRISQEEAFVGRCAQAGDELGSRVVAARLVRDLMRLCFLMEHQYAPYTKWFGTAFAQLPCAGQLTPILTGALQANAWPAREEHLAAAYEAVARMHNALNITEPLSTDVTLYYGRPFKVIHADRFARAISVAITSAEVCALPPYLGGIDQFVDSTDVLDNPALCRRVRAMFTA